MPDLVAELLDRSEIADVMCRFCRGLDRADRTLLEAIYHDGAMFEIYGTGVVKPAIEFVEDALRVCPKKYSRMLHSLGSISIDLKGDTAYTESYFTHSFVLREPVDGVHLVKISTGRYVDMFERREGVWRVAQRTMVLCYSENAEVDQSKYSGQREEVDWQNDPVYQR